MPETFPLQLLLATFAGWANRHQAQVRYPSDDPTTGDVLVHARLGGLLNHYYRAAA